MKKDNSARVYRGGSWLNDAPIARVAYRNGSVPSYRSGFLGFRLSRLVNPLKQMSEVLDEQR